MERIRMTKQDMEGGELVLLHTIVHTNSSRNSVKSQTPQPTVMSFNDKIKLIYEIKFQEECNTFLL